MAFEHLRPEQLAALEEGQPDRSTRDHLRVCPDCRSQLAGVRVLAAALRPPAAATEPRSHPRAEVLAEYAEGLLVGKPAQSVERHIETCKNCRAEIIAIHEVPDELSDEPTEEPAVGRLVDLLRRKLGKPEPVSLGQWSVCLEGWRTLFAPVRERPAVLAFMASSAALWSLQSKPEVGTHDVDVSERLRAALAAGSDTQRAAEAWITAVHQAWGEARVPAAGRVLISRLSEIVRHIESAKAEVAEDLMRLERRLAAGWRPELKLRLGDLLLTLRSLESGDPSWLMMQCTDSAGKPVEGARIEAHSPRSAVAVLRTDASGHTRFHMRSDSLRVRVVHGGSWEIELAREP